MPIKPLRGSSFFVGILLLLASCGPGEEHPNPIAVPEQVVDTVCLDLEHIRSTGKLSEIGQ